MRVTALYRSIVKANTHLWGHFKVCQAPFRVLIVWHVGEAPDQATYIEVLFGMETNAWWLESTGRGFGTETRPNMTAIGMKSLSSLSSVLVKRPPKSLHQCSN